MKSTRPIALLSLGLIAFVGGCSSYQPLETASPVSSIYLAPIVNNSNATQVVVNLQREVRTRLLTKGINLSENPDPSLEIVISSLERNATSRDSADSGKPASFRLRLVATVNWNSSSYPSPWGSETRMISVEKSVFVGSSLIESEYQVSPAMIEDLADKIAQLILYPW